MGMKDEFKKIVTTLAERFTLPPIDKMFLPPLYAGGQPRNAEFMAMGLEGGAHGRLFSRSCFCKGCGCGGRSHGKRQ